MRRLVRRLCVVAVVGIAAVITLLLALWMEHGTTTRLPAPRGRFRVSRVSEVWTDETRRDALAQSNAPRTELIAWIWYPSLSAATAPVEYLPPDWQRALAVHRGPILANFLMRDPANVRAHAVAAGPVATEQSSYPVIILRGGLGALTLDYTSLAEALASQGYVVVGFDAPYRTSMVVFPDGRVIGRPPHLNPETVTGPREGQQLLERLQAAWVSDIGFVLDRLQQMNASSDLFRDRLDLDKVAIAGHSLGGASAVEFCRTDSRCSAAVDMDGALYGPVIGEGVRRPVLFLVSDHGDRMSPSDQRIRTELHSAYDRSPAESRVALRIEGAGHFSFSDQMLMRSRALRLLDPTPIASDRALIVTGDVVGRFLNVHLKGGPTSQMQDLSRSYPEVREEFDSRP